MLKKLLIRLVILLSCSGCTLSTCWSYTPFTTRELDELEKEFVQQINQSDSIVRDPLARQYINHLGNQLAKHSNQPLPDFFIVKSNEINAFAGPGGHIGINTQLILASDSESELAGVMAHEMAHVRLHHLYRMIQHEKQMRIPMIASMLASAALGLINPVLGSGAMMATLTGVAQDSINYTRANEKEADRIGIDMLIKSGLNPKGMTDFFKKMQKNTQLYYTANIPPILRTHPLDRNRIAEAENRISQLPKRKVTESISYPYFKELIRNITQPDTKKLLDYYRSECRGRKQTSACLYGKALAFNAANDSQSSLAVLKALLPTHSDSLYVQRAYAYTLLNMGRTRTAMDYFSNTYANFPDSYAVIVSYAEMLLKAGQASEAVSVLIKGQRMFKADLKLCHLLSHAQSEAGMKSYAYFTLAHCDLLQGLKRSAMQQLKTAQKLVKNDSYLKARIEAKIEEVKFLAS